MRTNNQRIYQAFEVLTPSLARYVARELRDRYSNDWWDRGVLEATGRNCQGRRSVRRVASGCARVPQSAPECPRVPLAAALDPGA